MDKLSSEELCSKRKRILIFFICSLLGISIKYTGAIVGFKG